MFISVVHPSAALVTAINEIRRTHPGPKVVVAEVVNGLTAQLAAEQRVGHLMIRDGLPQIGPNVYTGGLSVSILKSDWPVTLALRRRVEEAATNHGAVTMPVDFHIGSPATTADF